VNWTVLHYITDTIEYEWFTVDCTVGGGMWRGCNLQDLRARLEARPGGCKHLGARQATLASCTSGCSHLTLGLPSLRCLGYLPVCWVEQAYMCHLSSCLNAEHTLRTHDAWATLGMTQTCAPLGTPGAWVMPLDSKQMDPASRPSYYWVLHQDPRFLDLRILNTIIYFKNIIIIKFQKKY